MLMCLSSQDRDTKDLLKSSLDQIRVSTTLKQFNLLTDQKEEGQCCYKSRSDSSVCYDVVHCKESSRHTNLEKERCWLMLLPYFTLNAAIVKKLNAAKDDTRRDGLGNVARVERLLNGNYTKTKLTENAKSSSRSGDRVNIQAEFWIVELRLQAILHGVNAILRWKRPLCEELSQAKNDFLFDDASRMDEIEELRNVNNGSVEKDTRVYDQCALETLTRNAYDEAAKQQIFAQKNFLELMKGQKRVQKQAESQLYRDRDIIRDLKKQRDKLSQEVKHFKQKNEELQQSHLILKRKMSENEDKYHDTILDLEEKLKKNVDLFLKIGNSLQAMFMLCPKPLSVYDQQLKHGLGYPNPLYSRPSNFTNCPSFIFASRTNSKRASMFYTSQEEIALKDFCRDQVKPLLNELLDYFDGFQNLFQRDIKEMKDAFEQNDVYLDEIERQNDSYISVKRPKSRDSHVKTSVLDVSKNEAKKEAVYVRKNKQTDNTFAKVVSNKENVIDVAVANASKAKTLLCVSCMQNVLIPCHDKCVAKHKLNVHSNARRTFSVNSRIPKSSKTTFVAPKTRFSEKATQSKTLDTTSVASKSRLMKQVHQKLEIRFGQVDYGKNGLNHNYVMWTPVNTKPHAHTNPSNTKPLVSVKRWIVKLPSSPCVVSSCVAGDDLLTGGRDSNLYTISISDMAASSPICLMSKATSTKSWLWHRRTRSHLNFGTINDLTKLDLVDGLPKFKYEKDHLCSACERGKSKKASHPPKLIPSDYSKLELLHMDLCGPMRVASVNGKKYILVIVDDFSRFTWVYFLRSKDETLEIIKKFIAQAQLNYKAKVCKIRTDNGTEFKNATLKAYYEKLGIMQQFSIARTPQQNGVVERRNRTLVEAARTMLIFQDDCKSTSEGVQFLGGKLVSWSSKKQDCTAMSTAEAEYVSLSACCAQVIWMRYSSADYGLLWKFTLDGTKIPTSGSHFTKALPTKERFVNLVHRIDAADVIIQMNLCPQTSDYDPYGCKPEASTSVTWDLYGTVSRYFVEATDQSIDSSSCNRKELTLTMDDFRIIFHLPQANDNNHASFVPPPSFSDIVPFYKQVLSFTMELKIYGWGPTAVADNAKMFILLLNKPFLVDYAELCGKAIYYCFPPDPENVDDSSPPRHDDTSIPGTRLEPRVIRKVPDGGMVSGKGEDRATKERRRRAKGKNVEESRISPIPSPTSSPRNLYTLLLFGYRETHSMHPVRSYMSGHILHVHPAQVQSSSIPEQQYQLYLAMKADPLLQQQDIAIWLALQIKFEKTQKTSEYEAYVYGESSFGQDNVKEPGPSTSSNQEQDDEFDFWTDSYASDDDEIPTKQVTQDIIEEISLTIDEAKLKKMTDEMLRQRVHQEYELIMAMCERNSQMMKLSFFKLFGKEIEVRLNYRDQMRRWEMYVNGRPLGPRRERPE
ncbi:retrovirus-related pol polyprotein from transposon TNT 1-94 [Tanacetum coccineum]|uniref:Retrovirus-related pol polyprotein from transposon TNT 1-94 n=1 Tax=Tanacetum coccineum TaxID=301880 RepID=A0ABQ5IJ80_9ASTR